MANDAKSKGRQKFEPIQEPAAEATHTPEERLKKIDEICEGFVSSSKANKKYYRAIIECLWPHGHGIPGPHVPQADIRTAIDDKRKESWPKDKPYKPYVDVFRRARELQGEEGLTGVAISGRTYQLVSLELGPKRVPRTKLTDADWSTVKEQYNNTCAACKRPEPEVRFQQDHKIPRTRGGKDGIENWQPLCDECNNFKSVSCRGCELDCEKCCWAFPEKFSPLRLPQKLVEEVNEYCAREALDINDFVTGLIKHKLEEVSN